MLKPEDWQAFTTYCDVWQTWRDARDRVQREGLVVEHPKTGMPHKHPAQSVVETATMQLLRYAQEFGLTPSAEINLAKPVGSAADGADIFAGGGA